ncbi:MAG: hypothetical protein IT384_03930 [Deltaproteobacteria bacterium]|nr:hypothetical protein [Deltaproteobacteria bacterium]
MSILLLALLTAVTATSTPPLDTGTLAFDAMPGDEIARVRVPWTEPSGTGVGVAYDNGSWGGEWMQGVRLNVPFGEHWGADARGLMLLGSDPSFGDRVDFGGRLELYGRSPVFLNLVRLYGGGGISVMAPVHGVSDPKATVGGGGYFGFEFFLNHRLSWILEVGGNSGSQDAFGSGATITAGLKLYPF